MNDNLTDIAKKEQFFLIPLMLIPCFLKIFGMVDNDIWFLLNHGRYVVQNGFPHVEPFTIHAGFQFVMQQWLSAVIFWFTYSSFGIVGLKLLVILLYALIILLLYKLCLKISDNNYPVSFLITTIISILIFSFMSDRPYIFSTLIFILELYFMESYILTKNRSYLYILPLLSVLLVNIQASMWLMLFVILLPYLIDSFEFNMGPFSGQGYMDKSLFLMIAASIPMGLINPYGIDAMTYIFRSYGIKEISSIVYEMKPPDINTALGKFIFASFLFVIVVHLCTKKRKVYLRYMLLTLGTAYLALSATRGLVFYAICGYPPLAYSLKDFKLSINNGLPKNKTMHLRKILIALLIIVLPVLFYWINKSIESHPDNSMLLNKTIQFVKETSDISQVKMYTGYNDGNLVEFNGIPSYLDTRAEVFVKNNNMVDDVMKEYYQLQTGSIYYKEFLEKYQFTHLILTEDDILYTCLKHDKDYQITYSNEEYTLFEKKQ